MEQGEKKKSPRVQVSGRTSSPHHSDRPKRKKGLVGTSEVLSSAAIMGDTHKLTQLLDKGLSLHSINEEGTTALHICAEHGHVPVVRLLCERNADVDAVNKALSSPLHVAVVNGHYDVVVYLLKQRASLDHADIGGHSGMRFGYR